MVGGKRKDRRKMKKKLGRNSDAIQYQYDHTTAMLQNVLHRITLSTDIEMRTNIEIHTQFVMQFTAQKKIR